jgi:hypothetical protein
MSLQEKKSKVKSSPEGGSRLSKGGSGCMVAGDSFLFLQSDNQKKEEGYPIAEKKRQSDSYAPLNPPLHPRDAVLRHFSFLQ